VSSRVLNGLQKPFSRLFYLLNTHSSDFKLLCSKFCNSHGDSSKRSVQRNGASALHSSKPTLAGISLTKNSLMSSFWHNPVLRSFLLGVLTVGVALAFVMTCFTGIYGSLLGGRFGLPSNLFRHQIITIAQIGWAWISLSIVGSYAWHTWYLDRTTHLGKLADEIMWIQYVVLLLLALLLYLAIPNEAKPGTEPFFG
jgi:hypothetical protein